MEALVFLFFVGFFVAGPVLAVMALIRVRRLADRLDQSDDAVRLVALERRLLELQRRLAAMEPPVTVTPPPSPAPAPSPPPAFSATPPPPTPAHSPAFSATPPPPTPAPSPMAPAPEFVPDMPSAPAVAPPPAQPPVLTRRPPEPPQPSEPPIDWERWIGIRGAAVAGAIALALAGLLFFRYSIEHGLITPTMRVVSGTLAGLACLVGAEWMRGRGYRQTAEGVSGAGVVILYAAFWAAHALYSLIPMAAAFVLMVLVTAGCCLLAVRHGSLLVAVLGLVGGFATPILLSSRADNPIGLFGYVLLLDLGLLAVGHRRNWPSLGVLSLAGTFVMQALWIFLKMGPERLVLGLIMLSAFSLLFVVAGRFAGDRAPRSAGVRVEIGAVLLPFVFALYFAGRTELGPHLYPIALLLGLLGAGAGWVSRDRHAPALAGGAATASVAVVAVWLMERTLTAPLAWELAAVSAGLALIFHLFVEMDLRPDGGGTRDAAVIAALGTFAILLAAAASSEVPISPWLAGWGALTAILYRHGALPGRGALMPVAAGGLGLGLTVLHHAHAGSTILPPHAFFLALLVSAAAALQAVPLLGIRGEARRHADLAAAIFPLLLLAGLAFSPFTPSLAPLPALGSAVLVGLLALTAATRLGHGAWVAGAAGATFLVHAAWTATRAGLHDRPSEIHIALLMLSAAVVLFTAWPLLAVARFSNDRLAWYTAALAGPLWFLPLRGLFIWSFGDTFIGSLPVALGALSLAAAWRARRAWPESDPIRLTALTWLAAVALCFLAAAIPMQLQKEWITIGWALEGLAVIALWTRIDHPGLKYFGLALLGATTVRLVFNIDLLQYHPRPGLRIVNWLMYTYLVPAAAMLLGAWLLKDREPARLRAWEADLYAGSRPAGPPFAGLAAIAVIFVWINLAIVDWFATGPSLRLDLGGPPAQRLTVSIAWAMYALALLGFGMARDTMGLRWLSLLFLLVTIGKVFLYDLGSLRDLYRVASLVGLAVSLILVSLLYQRFVFGKDKARA